MIKLYNGRGQLGSKLAKLIASAPPVPGDVLIYHTWNVDYKSKEAQKQEYDKFCQFLHDCEDNSRIIFISTKSQSDDWYVSYKHLAEANLLYNFY